MGKLLNIKYGGLHGTYWMLYGIVTSFASAFLLGRGYTNGEIGVILAVGNVVAVFLLLKYTNLGLYAIAGVSSVLLTLRILIFVPIYAASNINVKWTTFYPPLLKGIFLNVVLIAVFEVVKNMFVTGSILSFVCSIVLCGAVGYILGVIILSDKEDRTKAVAMIKKKRENIK